MAEILGFLFWRHLRAESTSHVLHYEGTKLRHSGRGLSFWYSPWSASLVEVPVDDRDVSLAFHGRTLDFQDVLVQGSIGFRVTDPVVCAQRVDFSIDPAKGRHLKQPLEKLASAMSQLAQQHSLACIQKASLRELVASGPEPVRRAIEEGIASSSLPADLGIELVSVRVEPLKPEAEVERALEAPTRERIQEESDEAAFRRRAQAVDKERAIQENELANQIELAKRETQLIEQRGQNARREATEKAESERIVVESRAASAKVDAEARADALRAVEGARLAIERERMEVLRTMPTGVMMALAAQELAGKLQRVEHLNITPDLLAPLLTEFLSKQRPTQPGSTSR